MDNKEFLSTTTDFRHNGQIERRKILHQNGCTMGLQQYTNPKRRQMEGRFQNKKGLFEPTVMFFGMCNSPATFQSMMDRIFATMIKEKLVIIYMDDILIFAKTEEELKRITKLVLEKLRENDLFLKAKKCKFEKTKIEYLGIIIEEG